MAKASGAERHLSRARADSSCTAGFARFTAAGGWTTGLAAWGWALPAACCPAKGAGRRAAGCRERDSAAVGVDVVELAGHFQALGLHFEGVGVLVAVAVGSDGGADVDDVLGQTGAAAAGRRAEQQVPALAVGILHGHAVMRVAELLLDHGGGQGEFLAAVVPGPAMMGQGGGSAGAGHDGASQE